jgi:hypothetical protein
MSVLPLTEITSLRQARKAERAALLAYVEAMDTNQREGAKV